MRSTFVSALLFATSVSSLHLPLTRRVNQRRTSSKSSILAARAGSIGLNNQFNNFYLATLNVAGKDVSVHVDTGSADFWLYNNGSGLLDTAYNANPANLTLIYGSGGSVRGPISQLDVSLGGFIAANQSFVNVQTYKNQPIIEYDLGAGLLGLGFDSLSPANTFVNGTYPGATWGRTFMSNIFEANPTLPKHIAFRLDRLFDNNDTDTGGLDIGTFAPGFEAVNDTAPIPIFTPPSKSLQFWSVLVDGIELNGQNQTLNSTVSTGDTKPPAGKLAVLLDTGYSSPQIAPDLFHALYTSMGGVLIQDGTNLTYAVPCMAESNLTFYIGGKPVPIHPLDLTSAEADDVKGTNMTTCLSMFEPISTAGVGMVDMILGDSFLRNAYTVFNYGGLVNGFSGNPSSNPYIKIMPLTEPTAASAEFKKARAAQLATLPPQVNVTTYNDAKPQAVQGSGTQGTSTNGVGKLAVGGAGAIATLGLVTVLMVGGCL